MDRMQFEGFVVDANKDVFKIQVSDTMIVSCTLSGKIRQNSIRILVGDKVKIEVSPLDTTKGRILQRYK